MIRYRTASCAPCNQPAASSDAVRLAPKVHRLVVPAEQHAAPEVDPDAPSQESGLMIIRGAKEGFFVSYNSEVTGRMQWRLSHS